MFFSFFLLGSLKLNASKSTFKKRHSFMDPPHTHKHQSFAFALILKNYKILKGQKSYRAAKTLSPWQLTFPVIWPKLAGNEGQPCAKWPFHPVSQLITLLHTHTVAHKLTNQPPAETHTKQRKLTIQKWENPQKMRSLWNEECWWMMWRCWLQLIKLRQKLSLFNYIESESREDEVVNHHPFVS